MKILNLFLDLVLIILAVNIWLLLITTLIIYIDTNAFKVLQNKYFKALLTILAFILLVAIFIKLLLSITLINAT